MLCGNRSTKKKKKAKIKFAFLFWKQQSSNWFKPIYITSPQKIYVEPHRKQVKVFSSIICQIQKYRQKHKNQIKLLWKRYHYRWWLKSAKNQKLCLQTNATREICESDYRSPFGHLAMFLQLTMTLCDCNGCRKFGKLKFN